MKDNKQSIKDKIIEIYRDDDNVFDTLEVLESIDPSLIEQDINRCRSRIKELKNQYDILSYDRLASEEYLYPGISKIARDDISKEIKKRRQNRQKRHSEYTNAVGNKERVVSSQFRSVFNSIFK